MKPISNKKTLNPAFKRFQSLPHLPVRLGAPVLRSPAMRDGGEPASLPASSLRLQHIGKDAVLPDQPPFVVLRPQSLAVTSILSITQI